MKSTLYSLIRFHSVYIIMLLAVLVVPLIAQGFNSDLNQSREMALFEQALANKGLEVCSQQEINWSMTPGFVSGKIYYLDLNCSSFDPNKPGARVWAVEFRTIGSRNYALRNFETLRKHIGSAIAWSKGSLVILVEGNQKQEVISALREALASVGIKK